jgi:uncharacterized protein (DUF934 family)
MWLLEAKGGFSRHDDFDGGTEIPGAGPAVVPDTPVATIRFGGQADGRGFSTANRLRALGYAGRLVAAGPLIPDQARHAVQSGFDAILVEDALVARHGEEAWRTALERALPEIYLPEQGSRGREHGLWFRRHNI